MADVGIYTYELRAELLDSTYGSALPVSQSVTVSIEPCVFTTFELNAGSNFDIDGHHLSHTLSLSAASYSFGNLYDYDAPCTYDTWTIDLQMVSASDPSLATLGISVDDATNQLVID